MNRNDSPAGGSSAAAPAMLQGNPAVPIAAPNQTHSAAASRHFEETIRGATSPTLSQRIQRRIKSRTGERIRDLAVKVSGEQIELHGRCATFYTKQLAQHAAMGVLEHEILVNLITVGPLRP